MSCPKCGGAYPSSGVSGGMGVQPKRYCVCGVRQTNRYSERGSAPGISAGMHSMPPASNISYSYRPATTSNGDIDFWAGLVVGAIVGIILASAFVFIF